MKKKRTNPRKKVMSQADINKAIEQAARETHKETGIMNVVVAVMSAHDVFDFGPKRCERLAVDMIRKYNDWDEDLFTAEDALEWFESYTGMKIEGARS